MKTRLTDGIEVQQSFGNVVADPGPPDAKKLKIKTGLLCEIRKAVHSFGLTELEAAKHWTFPIHKL